MNKYRHLFFISILLLFIPSSCNTPDSKAVKNSEEEHHLPIEALKIENLFRDSVALAKDVEVIVSYLECPPNTTLPTHYHPGEEYVYILEGQGELTLQDESSMILKEGDFYKIPLERVHTFTTADSEARAVVFRLHKSGQPDRILVE
jgi:quercetin dioxygenase-like cupin family protein